MTELCGPAAQGGGSKQGSQETPGWHGGQSEHLERGRSDDTPHTKGEGDEARSGNSKPPATMLKQQQQPARRSQLDDDEEDTTSTLKSSHRCWPDSEQLIREGSALHKQDGEFHPISDLLCLLVLPCPVPIFKAVIDEAERGGGAAVAAGSSVTADRPRSKSKASLGTRLLHRRPHRMGTPAIDDDRGSG